jgi:hypothetical protein
MSLTVFGMLYQEKSGNLVCKNNLAQTGVYEFRKRIAEMAD